MKYPDHYIGQIIWMQCLLKFSLVSLARLKHFDAVTWHSCHVQSVYFCLYLFVLGLLFFLISESFLFVKQHCFVFFFAFKIALSKSTTSFSFYKLIMNRDNLEVCSKLLPDT